MAAPLISGGHMDEQEKVNIPLVDDQPDKVLSYEAILRDLGQLNSHIASYRT